MACTEIQPVCLSTVDDEMVALTFQLEEIGIFSENAKGKYAADSPPDFEVAYQSFQAELKELQAFFEDRKLAQSIGAAVYSDGPTIGELTAQEVQSHDDHQVAVHISENDPECESPPLAAPSRVVDYVRDYILTATESQYAGSVIGFSDDESEAGPSMTYAECQADVLDKLAREVRCVACHEALSSGLAITVPCGDKYCPDCLKRLFILATKDESLMPVRCHRQPIPYKLIARHLSDEELKAFETADLEFSTANRIYCSNRDCGRFIPPGRLYADTGKAICEYCDTATCGICKNSYHEDEDCPDDPALQETRELALSMGWKSCYHCGSLVILRSGCNHMT